MKVLSKINQPETAVSTSILLPLEVVVEKVCVQQRLNHPTNIHHPVMLVLLLSVGSVDPIQDVQESVGSHEKDVVASQVLHFPVALDDNQLRKDSNRF